MLEHRRSFDESVAIPLRHDAIISFSLVCPGAQHAKRVIQKYPCAWLYYFVVGTIYVCCCTFPHRGSIVHIARLRYHYFLTPRRKSPCAIFHLRVFPALSVAFRFITKIHRAITRYREIIFILLSPRCIASPHFGRECVHDVIFHLRENEVLTGQGIIRRRIHAVARTTTTTTTRMRTRTIRYRRTG